LTGNITLSTQTSYLPITPQQIIDDAVRAADAGVASVHIHAGDITTTANNGSPSTEWIFLWFYLRNNKLLVMFTKPY
jgi:uncharacterized protein (DUF849 family)